MDDPLVGLDNCLIVPHIASASRATRGKMAAAACSPACGEPLPTPVTIPGGPAKATTGSPSRGGARFRDPPFSPPPWGRSSLALARSRSPTRSAWPAPECPERRPRPPTRRSPSAQVGPSTGRSRRGRGQSAKTAKLTATTGTAPSRTVAMASPSAGVNTTKAIAPAVIATTGPRSGSP